MAEAFTGARERRIAIRASITKFEARIAWWEGKADFTGSDHRAIQHCVETLKEYDADFKPNHFAIVESRSTVVLLKYGWGRFKMAACT